MTGRKRCHDAAHGRRQTSCLCLNLDGCELLEEAGGGKCLCCIFHCQACMTPQPLLHPLCDLCPAHTHACIRHRYTETPIRGRFHCQPCMGPYPPLVVMYDLHCITQIMHGDSIGLELQSVFHSHPCMACQPLLHTLRNMCSAVMQNQAQHDLLFWLQDKVWTQVLLSPKPYNFRKTIYGLR